MSARHIVMTAGLLTAATLLPLASARAMADTRVGFVNTIELMNDSPQGKAALQEMKTEFAPREEKLAARRKDIQRLEGRLQRGSTVMSKTEMTKLEQEVRAKELELRRAEVRFRNELTARRNKVLVKLHKKFYDAVKEVARRDKYSLIVGQGVVYARRDVNITRQVLVLLDKEDRMGAGRPTSKK